MRAPTLSPTLLLLLLLYYCLQMDIYSNYSPGKTIQLQTSAAEAVSLPVVVLPPRTFAKNTTPLYQLYNLTRYEYKDTKYDVEEGNLTELEKGIVYGIETHAMVFDVGRVITIEDYQLLEMREIRVVLVNPTAKLRFCVNEIYADTQAIRRVEQRKLPFCLDPYNKYPFFFNLYIVDYKPLIFRTTLYFIVSIYDGDVLVDEKIWPREIVTKVSNNPLRISALELKSCGEIPQTTLIIPNPNNYGIRVSFEMQMQAVDKTNLKQVLIPTQKSFRMVIPSKQSTIVITIKPVQASVQGRFPQLHLPILCTPALELGNLNIAVVNSQRSVYDLPIPIINQVEQDIEIKSVELMSSTGAVELVIVPENEEKILPNSQFIGNCRILVHVPKEAQHKTVVDLKVSYSLAQNPKQVLQARRSYKFLQIRNPISSSNHQFIDITRNFQMPKKPDSCSSAKEFAFPIRNNLNLPILLNRIFFDEKTFRLTWLQDRREYIFPNQQRDEFSLQYIGEKDLPISPRKMIILLEFNGGLMIPVEILLYDHSLQCVYNNIRQKCQNLGVIDYGYFRTDATKNKQIMIRNWNPMAKEIRIKLSQNFTQAFGINCSLSISGPFPHYQAIVRKINDTLVFNLKGNHYIQLDITMAPLPNATSGEGELLISTDKEEINKKIKFKVENGTIALIPQILRIPSAYESTTEYLNLVSTFSQPYKIKTTSVNSSNIHVYFNNHSEIYENQWIGIALVYSPFKTLIIPGSILAQQSHVPASLGLYNYTEICCGPEFANIYFINALLNGQNQRFTYVFIRVVTTTELQANATIIIDNKAMKFIKEDSVRISMISYNNYAGMSKKDMNDYKLLMKNPYKQIAKYKPILVPKALYEDTKHYISTMKRVRKVSEQTTFCVSPSLISKHHFSPQMVKTLFGLQSTPQESIMEPFQRQQHYFDVNGEPNDLYNQLSAYVQRSLAKGARTCYKFTATKYIKDLIDSNVVNDLAEIVSNQQFLLFIEKQMENYNTPLNYLSFDDFYESLPYNFDTICKKTVYPLFRFCKQIGVSVFTPGEQIIAPGEQKQIYVRSLVKVKQIEQVFYLVLLNNITKYEVHLVEINITEPRLNIDRISFFVIGRMGIEMDQYLSQSMAKPEVYKALKALEVVGDDNGSSLGKSAVNVMPLILSQDHDSKQSGFFEGMRRFYLKNTGSIDIVITHIGFENSEILCNYEGIEVDLLTCLGFRISPGGEYRFKLLFKFPYVKQSKIVNMYLYNNNSYYFQIKVLIVSDLADNNADQSFLGQSFYSSLLSLSSFVYLVLVILVFKKEIDEKENARLKKNKLKIMKKSRYPLLGTKIQKKVRRIQTIPEQLITAVKDIHQSRLKQFFNSSGQSEIAKKNQIEQEQPTNIQILNALKQDRNNLSVSEQSSIDFIDLNALNKSSQNQEGLYEEKVQEMSESMQRQSQEIETEEEESQPDSDFSEGGNQIDFANLKQDFGWDDTKKQVKQPKKQEVGNFYYNVFFSENPLKKKQAGPFHWMNEPRNYR